MRTTALGIGLLAVALVLGFTAAATTATDAHATHGGGNPTLTAVALLVLGLGWSAGLIGASALLAGVVEPHVKVPLQGASDAAMNYAGAAAAAVAGPVLAAGGFEAVNVVGAVILVPAVVALVVSARRRARLGG